MPQLIERPAGGSPSSVTGLTSRRVSGPPPGAVVLGGDFNGLAIVRSLGRRGIPVCVIDDETSIARASRYATYAVKVSSLRDDAAVVDAVLQIGRRLGLDGWVLYPTRDEIVAAVSRRRTVLERQFVISTPTWSRVRWAWDKRNTYRRAADRGIPVPRTWAPRDVHELGGLPVSYPVAIKPAIKEHFIYHTKAKAWRADDLRATRGQVREGAGFPRRRRGHGAGVHPGRRPAPIRLLLLLQAFAIARNHGRATPATASGGIRACEHLRRDRRPSRARIDVRGVPSVDRLLRSRRARVQARPAGRRVQTP